jgi:hypothetical protein
VLKEQQVQGDQLLSASRLWQEFELRMGLLRELQEAGGLCRLSLAPDPLCIHLGEEEGLILRQRPTAALRLEDWKETLSELESGLTALRVTDRMQSEEQVAGGEG